MDALWTLPELVSEVAARIAALPPPGNGQVRAVPDERTVRYYGTIGLLDRPAEMRGRTALYGKRHLAQVVAIKRLQSSGKSLADIQALWVALDDETLARMSGVGVAQKQSRKSFWKAPTPVPVPVPVPALPAPPLPAHTIELRIELAPGAVLSLSTSESHPLSAEDLRAIRAAAQPLIAELARRPLATNAHEGDTP